MNFQEFGTKIAAKDYQSLNRRLIFTENQPNPILLVAVMVEIPWADQRI